MAIESYDFWTMFLDGMRCTLTTSSIRGVGHGAPCCDHRRHRGCCDGQPARSEVGGVGRAGAQYPRNRGRVAGHLLAPLFVTYWAGAWSAARLLRSSQVR
jgi:hypothetical protein